MKRWKNILKTILIAVPVAFILFFLVYAFITWPIYHSFTKDVNSYDELCAAFKDSNDVFLPEEDDIPTLSYTILMDGRTRFAKPETYSIFKQEKRGDITVNYSLYCAAKGETPCKGTQEYNGVAYDVISQKRQEDNEPDFYGVYLSFDIGGVFYRFDASYKCDMQSLEDEKTTEEQLRAQLEIYAKQVIDKYNASLE